MLKLYTNNINILLHNDNAHEFLNTLKTKWDELHQRTDVFRYQINNLQERVVDEKYLLQLNPDRNTNRRTPEHIEDVRQPFDKSKFNFTKASPKEIMFNLVEQSNDSVIHTVLVNVSPISRYHSLLCPSVLQCLPQVATQESLELVLKVMFFADRTLRIGFNSLCAFASVNHLHYHIFVENTILPVENVKCKHLKGPLYCMEENYPAPAFCFEISQDSVTTAPGQIYKLIDYFLKNSIAHNVFVTRGDSVVPESLGEAARVLIWPRKSNSGVKQLQAFNVAVCELSGWFPVYNKQDYENLKTGDLENELSKWKVENFEELCNNVIQLY